MSPVVIAAIVAVVIIAIVVGADLFDQALSDRFQLTREQRRREDDAIRHARAIEDRNFIVDAVATGFDPLGLFH